MHVPQMNESAHLNSWKFDTTDRLTDCVPWADHRGRAGGLDDGEAAWSTVPVKGHFDEFHNQWLLTAG